MNKFTQKERVRLLIDLGFSTYFNSFQKNHIFIIIIIIIIIRLVPLILCLNYLQHCGCSSKGSPPKRDSNSETTAATATTLTKRITTTTKLDMFNNTEELPCVALKTGIYIFPILTAISLVGHVTVLRTIWKHEQLHNPSYFLIGSLCVADLLLCALFISIPVINKAAPGAEWPMMIALVMARAAYSSMGSTSIFLAFSRLSAVTWPYFYQSLFVFKKTLTMLLFIWGFLLAIFAATIQHGRPPFTKRRAQNMITLTLSWLSVILEPPMMLYTQHKGRCVIATLLARTNRLHGCEAEQCTVLRMRLQKNKEVGYLFLFSQLFGIPLYVYQTILFAQGDNPDHDTLECTAMISSMFYYLQTTLHPVIYARTMHDLRVRIAQDMRKLFRMRPVVLDNS